MSANNIIKISNRYKFIVRVLIKLILIILLLHVFHVVSHAEIDSNSTQDTYNKGLNFIKNGKYESAFRILMPLAKRGDADAQCIIGNMYYDGLSVDKSIDEAIEWLNSSALGGNNNANQSLAAIYIDIKEYKKAKKLLEISISSGNSVSMHYLGMMYYYGYGIPVDYCKAKKLFEDSIREGNFQSYAFLSSIFIEGLCGEQDLYLALRYAFHSANINDKRGQALLGKFYEDGIIVNKDCREALLWYRRSFENGNKDIINHIKKIEKICR